MRMTPAIILACLATSATAQDMQSYSTVHLLPGHMTAQGQYLAGVQIVMAPGWKTYWRQPGEGGIPPTFDWSGSSNINPASVEWPVPDVFDTYGLRSLGYHDRVIFPVLFDVADPTAVAALELSLDFGLCADICIPVHATVTTTAPLEQVQNANILADARANTTEPASGIVARCAVVPAAGAWRLDVTVTGDGPLSPQLVAVVETPDPALWIGTPDAVEQDSGLLFSAPMDWFGDGAFTLARQDVRITLVQSGRSAVELTGC